MKKTIITVLGVLVVGFTIVHNLAINSTQKQLASLQANVAAIQQDSTADEVETAADQITSNLPKNIKEYGALLKDPNNKVQKVDGSIDKYPNTGITIRISTENGNCYVELWMSESNAWYMWASASGTCASYGLTSGIYYISGGPYYTTARILDAATIAGTTVDSFVKSIPTQVSQTKAIINNPTLHLKALAGQIEKLQTIQKDPTAFKEFLAQATETAKVKPKPGDAVCMNIAGFAHHFVVSESGSLIWLTQTDWPCIPPLDVPSSYHYYGDF